MTKWIPTFGVEIHAELNTNTKAFSPAKVDFNAEPNTCVHPIDLGYPGAKPTVNEKMVEYSYRLAKVLKMDIEDKLYFDRKGYFYPDLPKGFQITQFFKPIGTNGKFTILLEDGTTKDISITEIHMEEDTAKQIKTEEGILFDFNRAGVPLIEIVSGHEELSSVEEVVTFVKQLRTQIVSMGINDGKMEEGSFRIDINVSVRPEGQEEYGTRTEIKNLNSFENIKVAVQTEIERQISIHESGETLETTTVRFDESTKQTIPMRIKDSGEDYNFIPEGNITPLTLSQDLKDKFSDNDDKILFDFISSLIEDKKQVKKLMENNESISLFIEHSELYLNPLTKNTMENEYNSIRKELNSEDIDSITVNGDHIKKISELRKEGKLNSKQSYNLLKESMLGEDINEKLESASSKEMMSEEELKEIISNIIINNKEMIEKDKADRPERVEKFVMGNVMKETKGQASPVTANKLVKEALWNQ